MADNDTLLTLCHKIASADAEAPATEVDDAYLALARHCIVDMGNAPASVPVLIEYFRTLRTSLACACH